MVDYPDIIISVSISVLLIFTKGWYDKWQKRADIKNSFKNEISYNKEFIYSNPQRGFSPDIQE